MSYKWLSILGIGEDGIAGLTPIASFYLDRASVIVGGDRHLAMLPQEDTREKIVWDSPIYSTIEAILNRRGEAICILASGDPMCFGIGATFARHLSMEEMTIIPAPSAFSLACARLGWSTTEIETLSLCGREIAFLNYALYPGAKILLLSAGKHTPAQVAKMLVARGYEKTEMIVLENMGGDREGKHQGIAATWDNKEVADLNVIALNCIASPSTLTLSRLAGLPDEAYRHDGQLTKKEVRAITLSALSPLPGQLLWDVGAGCGSISLEWMRSDKRCRAIAIEQNPKRLEYIKENAHNLGVPNLKIIAGFAPEALKELPQPNTIFIGGGLTTPQLLETCWNALPIGGRLVANGVTLESEQKLLESHAQRGGELTRIGIQRTHPVGNFLSWKAMAPITQWVVIK